MFKVNNKNNRKGFIQAILGSGRPDKKRNPHKILF